MSRMKFYHLVRKHCMQLCKELNALASLNGKNALDISNALDIDLFTVEETLNGKRVPSFTMYQSIKLYLEGYEI